MSYFQSQDVSLRICPYKSPFVDLLAFVMPRRAHMHPIVYLVIESDRGCLTRFVACKTPAKEQTIPPLELLSALLLSNLMTSVFQALSLELLLGES